jgi:diguanylate cyclase (GGDEF)-like protein
VMHTRLNIDTLARYGGEEFVLILPETGLQGARIVAEKIREEVASTPFGEEDDEPIDVSVSIGYASYPEHGLTQQALVDAADKAMYEAKARGRNRVVGADELGF